MSQVVKSGCVTATVGPITLAGEQVINGFTVEVGMRVLVKDQADRTQNGIWICQLGAWVRAADFNSSNDLKYTVIVPVSLGADGDPDARLFMLNAGWNPVFGSTDLVFALVGDSDSGSGGGGGDAYDPSEVVTLGGVAVIDTAGEVEEVDQTGSMAAPYDSIADALATLRIAGRTGDESAIYLTRRVYSESLGFKCQDQNLALVGYGRAPVMLSGNHTVTVANSGYGFRAQNIGFDGTNDFVVHDGTDPASSNPAVLEFVDCDKVSVAPDGSSSSLYHVVIAATIPATSSVVPERRAVYTVTATGSVLARGVVVGDGSGKVVTASAHEYEGCVFRTGVTILCGGTEITFRNCRFEGALDIEFTDSAGVVDIDAASLRTWTSAPVTLTNGVIVSSGAPAPALPDSDATITYAQGSVRSIIVGTLTANRDYTGDVAGLSGPLIWTINRYDVSGFTADFVNGGPGGGSTPILAGHSHIFMFDEADGDWFLAAIEAF